MSKQSMEMKKAFISLIYKKNCYMTQFKRHVNSVHENVKQFTCLICHQTFGQKKF